MSPKTKLTPDTTIKPGDPIRSYDFPELVGTPAGDDIYIDGVVCMILPVGEVHEATGAHFYDCDRYVIVVTAKMRDGVLSKNPPPFVYPPVNGTPTTLGRVTCAVVKRAI